jgi:hypothetical protein
MLVLLTVIVLAVGGPLHHSRGPGLFANTPVTVRHDGKTVAYSHSGRLAVRLHPGRYAISGPCGDKTEIVSLRRRPVAVRLKCQAS